MTATNHALTGAIIGFSVVNPLLAIPLALISHFALDAVPHFDFEGDTLTRLRSKGFLYFQLYINATACVALVLLLALMRPNGWLLAAICAFLAALPDVFSIPQFLKGKMDNKLEYSKNRLQRFHQTKLQWKIGPQFWWVELAWSFACLGILRTYLW